MADPSSTSNNTNQAKIWTEKNIFTKSITFSSDQIFPIEGLSYNNHHAGSILFATGSGWDVLRPSKNNQVLTFNARGLTWQTPSLSIIEGVLPVSKGGTGWSLFPDNGILINTGKEMLDLMPIPRDKKILIGENQNLSWENFSEIAKEVLKSYKTILINGNDAILEEYNPSLLLKDQMITGGMNLNFRDLKFSVGVNSPILRNQNTNYDSSLINFNVKDKTISFTINNKKVLEIDEDANLKNVVLQIDQLEGMLPISKGGFGGLKFDVGDLIYAKNPFELGTLSPIKCEGHYLQIVNGLPTFAPLDKSGFNGLLEVPLVLNTSKNGIPPLRFQRSPLVEKSLEGSMEFDGNNLFFTNSQGRKAVAFLSSDIVGKSSNVTGIVSIQNGGTGQNLTDLAIGQILIKNHEVLGSFDQGLYGQVLMSQGACSMPSWRDAILDLDTSEDSGIILEKSQGVVETRIDQSINFNPTWQGKHTFIQPIELKSKLVVNDKNQAPLNFEINKTVRDLHTGDVWFDGENLNFYNGNTTVNLTSPQESSNNQEINQSHYLTLAAGSDVSENRKIRMKTPVPPLTTRGSLAFANWKIRKLDILLDEAANESVAIFKLKCGNKILIDQGVITVGKDNESFESFNEIIISTGEILQLECLSSGGSNYWSAFLLIDLL
jgi:hypothetical protein